MASVDKACARPLYVPMSVCEGMLLLSVSLPQGNDFFLIAITLAAQGNGSILLDYDLRFQMLKDKLLKSYTQFSPALL